MLARLPCSGGSTAAAARSPDGPSLRPFTRGNRARGRRVITLRTIGTDARRPLVLARGSRPGVVPRLAGGDGLDRQMATCSPSPVPRCARRRAYTRSRADGTGLHFIPGTRGGSNPVFVARTGARERVIGEGRATPGAKAGVVGSLTPWVARRERRPGAHGASLTWRRGGRSNAPLILLAGPGQMRGSVTR